MSEQIHPPVSLGRQQLLFSVGHGGMSDVYLALVNSAVGVNKLLVVKQLRVSLLDEPEALSMFMDEARLAARLHHPNVVATFEVGQEGPIPYMTMEFLDGQPLHRILQRVAVLGVAGVRDREPSLEQRIAQLEEMVLRRRQRNRRRRVDDPVTVDHEISGPCLRHRQRIERPSGGCSLDDARRRGNRGGHQNAGECERSDSAYQSCHVALLRVRGS